MTVNPRFPRPFLLQHLDMAPFATVPHFWARFATIDEAREAADKLYSPTNLHIRQDIVETIDEDTREWRFRGGIQGVDWSRPRRGYLPYRMREVS